MSHPFLLLTIFVGLASAGKANLPKPAVPQQRLLLNLLPKPSELISGVGNLVSDVVSIFGNEQRPEHEPLPSNFVRKSAEEKMTILMKNINDQPYDKLPNSIFDPLTAMKVFKPTYLVKAFTWESDEMIEDRAKLIHTFGSCGRISLEIFDNSTFTGIFAPGQKSDGIARLSLAVAGAVGSNYQYTPGMAIKIPVTGRPSHSLITMFATSGQGKDKNFFANTFTNQIPDAHGLFHVFLGGQFGKALDYLPGGVCDRPLDEGKLPMWTPASMSQDGKVTNTPKVPEVINFVPTSAVGWSKDTTEDTRAHLARIPTDTVLYKLTVKSSRDSADSKVIGQLVLKEEFVTSDYCDSVLYFQHHAKRC